MFSYYYRMKTFSAIILLSSTRFSSCGTVTKLQPINILDGVCVISSSSRGIGLEFTKQILEKTNMHVFGLVRSKQPDLNIPQLKLWQQYPERLHLITGVDLEDQTSIENAVKSIEQSTERVDLLINVSGLLGDGISTPGPERSISMIDRDWLTKSMNVNLIGHVMITKALMPLLSQRHMKKEVESRPYAKVVNLSARVGSISDNSLGGWYSYRMSKAALNMFTKTLSIEGKRDKIIAISCHPGTTDTDLSKPFQKNVIKEKLFTTEKSVSQMLNVIWSLKTIDSGKFFAYDGKEILY